MNDLIGSLSLGYRSEFQSGYFFIAIFGIRNLLDPN